MKYLFFIITLFSIYCYADPVEKNKKYKADEYLNMQNKYKDEVKKYFKGTELYNSIQKKVFEKQSTVIKNFWSDAEFTNKFKWVEYSADYSSKKSIDFKNKQINLEVIAENPKEAKYYIEKLFTEILSDTTKSAYQNENIEEQILAELDKSKLEVQSANKLIADLLKTDEKNLLKKQINTANIKQTKYKKSFIYKITLDLPKNLVFRSAKKYSTLVQKSATRYMIPPELIFSIIHIESHFNPLGRSALPSYGLMQIIPRRTGAKGYLFIHKKEGIPIPSYLYNSVNNINIGSAYLHILFHKNLKNISDVKSKLYCIIASYNYGLDNVVNLFAKAFEVDKAVNVINSMSSEEVYQYLQEKLPDVKSKIYLKQVMEKIKQYSKLLDEKAL